MTENFEDFDREERLFSDALRASAEAESFRPLAGGEFTRPRTPERLAAWGRGIAAAAAAVVVIGGLAFGLSHLGGSGSAASVPAEPASGLGGAGRDAAPSTEAASGESATQDVEGEQPVVAQAVAGGWQDLAAPPLSARSEASGAWLDGKFYLVGGQLDQPCPPNADCIAPSKLLRDGASYDPVAGAWTRIADAPEAIWGSPPTAVGGRLYFQFGYDESMRVFAYTPAVDRWTQIATPKGGGALVAAGDRLVAINYSDEVPGFDELYDADTGTWTRLPDDPLGKSFNRSALWVNGKLMLGAHTLVANPGAEEPSLVQLAELERQHQRNLADQLLVAGVRLADPARIDVRGELRHGRDVAIDVGCVFEGKVELGDAVEVGPYCVLKNVKVGAGTRIAAFCHFEDAVIGPDGVLGPYARLRPGTELGPEVHIGNFVEVKKSKIAAQSKANHLAYIGDAEIGQRVNVGAGTITCNYDGANKHLTVIEDDVFIGSDTQLVAPVRVGRGATLGAGTTLTKDAPPDALTVSRAKQMTLPGWARPQKVKK